MGATESKLAFRKGVFRLFEERVGDNLNELLQIFMKTLTMYFILYRIFEPLTSIGRR